MMISLITIGKIKKSGLVFLFKLLFSYDCASAIIPGFFKRDKIQESIIYTPNFPFAKDLFLNRGAVFLYN